MTLARVRAEIEPCADHEYAAFRLRWMHVGGAELPADQTGVAAVLDQLSGVAATPEIWEHAILPARIAGYRPEMLDLVCMSGQMKWVAVAGEKRRRRAAASVPARVASSRARPRCFCRAKRLRPRTRRSKRSWRALGAAARSISTRSPSARTFPSATRCPRCGGWRRRAASATTTSRRCGCSPTIATPNARSSRSRAARRLVTTPRFARG